MNRGFPRERIRSIVNPGGRGSGEQFVRERYPMEVKEHRRKAGHITSLCLAVIVDADTYTVEQRLKQLDAALAASGQERRKAHERIAIFVPKQNIETWIYYGLDRTVNAGDTYPKLARQRACKPSVERFLNDLCPAGLPNDAPPSLHTACEELNRIS